MWFISARAAKVSDIGVLVKPWKTCVACAEDTGSAGGDAGGQQRRPGGRQRPAHAAGRSAGAVPAAGTGGGRCAGTACPMSHLVVHTLLQIVESPLGHTTLEPQGPGHATPTYPLTSFPSAQ